MGENNEESTENRIKSSCGKCIVTLYGLIFSQTGICVMLTLYTVFGAFLFHTIEKLDPATLEKGNSQIWGGNGRKNSQMVE